MARQNITQFFDALDHTPLHEADVRVIRFGLQGKNYVLDLKPENAERFLAQLKPYVEAAREACDATDRALDPAEIRRWAQTEGLPIANRGKIPLGIVEAFHEAHPYY
ncbi:Lsr2 family protein [Corynebacterium sp. CCUG 61414]|uniref:histone-like nucleoid-structuring protein Lsr2 n=1 Tax=Corynebacterium sp. CCUG 61414 TaxID=2823896 RepID=UPI0021099762|nr:Lsr2 family protein [Corynebacterium sp. CCUG 61414]MCQ4609864.1 Lsr2 family protein [Corynebacterium sp. CCUG 61414]